MWLSEKKGSHTNLLAKQFHQAFYWRVGFVKDILSDSFISRFRIRIRMLVWTCLYCMFVLLCSIKSYILYVPPDLKFPADCSFSAQNINECWLFMVQHYLHIKYFIHKWNAGLADQIKKAEYILHPDLLCG